MISSIDVRGNSGGFRIGKETLGLDRYRIANKKEGQGNRQGSRLQKRVHIYLVFTDQRASLTICMEFEIFVSAQVQSLPSLQNFIGGGHKKFILELGHRLKEVQILLIRRKQAYAYTKDRYYNGEDEGTLRRKGNSCLYKEKETGITKEEGFLKEKKLNKTGPCSQDKS